MSYARLSVGGKDGKILVELTPDIQSISWRLNKVGKCSFSMAITDPKVVESNLRYGNKILIEFDNGLPNWGGVIEPPRGWDKGIIKITAFSGEQLFRYRTTDKGRYFSNASVGTIYQALINEANAIENMGIVLGKVWTGGNVHNPDYHYKDLLDIFQKSLTTRMSTADFGVTVEQSGGYIVFTAHLYESRGSDKTKFALIQDKNISTIKLKEQGPIINSWDIAGEGTDWGDDRLTANSRDITSIGIYGLREDSKVYSDVSLQGTIDDHANNLLAATTNPYNIFSLSALDKEPAKFADYDLGDTISLTAPDYEFGGTDTTVRILSRSFVPDTGICDLVVQEVI